MEIKSFNSSPSCDGSSRCLYGLGIERAQVSNYQNQHQTERGLGRSGLGETGEENLPTYHGQSPSSHEPCTFGRTTGDGCSAFFPTDHIPIFPVSSGEAAIFSDETIWKPQENKQTNKINEFRDSFGLSWPADRDLKISPLTLGTRNISGSFYHEGFTLTPYLQKPHCDLIAGVADLPNYLYPNKFVDTTAVVKCQTSHTTYLQSTSVEYDDTKPCLWQYQEYKPSFISPGPIIEFSSSFDSDISNIAMAHQAVADLFPELVEIRGQFEAKGVLHYEQASRTKGPVVSGIYEAERPVSPSRLNKSDYRLIKPNDSTGAVAKSSENEWSRSEPSASMGLSTLEIEGEIAKFGKEHTYSDNQTAFIVSSSTPLGVLGKSLDARILSQSSPKIIALELKNSSHPELDTGDDLLCSGETISPLYLSRNRLPSVSPDNTFFHFEEGGYENIICEAPNRESREEPTVTKDEDMLDVLSTGSEFKSSGPEDSECSFCLLSPAASPVSASSEGSSPSPIPVLEPDLSNPAVSSELRDARFSSPGKLHISLPLKLTYTSKVAPKDKLMDKDSKALVNEQNKLLLRWRAQGISYKIIKERLGIDEAESTLRGRLRTLTKPKNERLRRPQWTEEDIVLLLEIVDPKIVNVKWKQVSETIVSLGGSYRFGPSTCKKQYMRLIASGRAQPLAESFVGSRLAAKLEIGNPRIQTRGHCNLK